MKLVNQFEYFLALSSLLSSTIAGVSVESVRLEGSCKNREGPQDDKMVSGVLEREPYSCERLSHIRGGFTALTLAQPVLCFDFTQPQVSSSTDTHTL